MMKTAAEKQINHIQMFAGQSITMLTIQPHTTSSGTLAKWFQEATGATVNIIPVPYSEITGIATSDVQSGTGNLDVIQYWYPMLGSLVQEEIITDITAWWDHNNQEINPSDFIPVFSETWCVKNKRRFGIPYDGDMHLLFYNTILFEKYGLQPPKTWDEYLQFSKIITIGEKGNNGYGCGIMAANIPLILIGTFLNRLAGYGGDFFDLDGKPVINSAEAVSALKHLLEEMAYAVPIPTEMAFDEMLAPWLAGRVGMVEFWGDLGKITDNPEQSTIPHKWGVVPLPSGPGPKARVAAPLNAGWSLGVSTASKNKELALEFLKFILDPKIQLRICTINGGLDPVRWSTYELTEYQNFVTPQLATAARSAVTSNAVPWPTMETWPKLQVVLCDYLFQALTKRITPDQALNATQAAWIELLK
jgi:multiple sugar transport system substrate-binding protein